MSPLSLFFSVASLVAVAVAAVACSSSAPSSPRPDAGAISLGDAGPDAGPVEAVETPKPLVDGGYEVADAGVIRADRFATEIARFTPGDCAGFGAAKMPSIVLGPPAGAGAYSGGLDVLSLGAHGEIVLSFGANAIVDGPGPDLLVFENAFWANGDSEQPAADLGEVSVSEDGATWKTFPCAPSGKPPYGSCAGWRPVYSAPGNGVSPIDPAVAGGDPFDLADVGMTRARFVRVRDVAGGSTCPAAPPKPTNLGFDLDAVAIVHSEL